MADKHAYHSWTTARFLMRALLLTVSLTATVSLGQSYPLSYGGRIVDPSTGIGYTGAASFDLKFYDASTGGSQIGTTFSGLPATLQDGVFQLDLTLTGADLKTYFQPASGQS
jgi:hypothetical protein